MTVARGTSAHDTGAVADSVVSKEGCMNTFPDPNDRGAPIAGPEEGSSAPVLSGHEAYDERHEKIGKVTDVLYDEQGEPRWAVVNPGMLHRERYVPVEGAFMTDAGEVVVAYSKDTVKSARPANRDHILDPVVERALEEHYAVPHR
jgi:hypothetical protein